MSGNKPFFNIGGIEERIQRNLGRAMFAARWIMAPIYLGLLVALLLIVVKFVEVLIEGIPGFLKLNGNDAVFLVLKLVDLSLIANLIVIVIFAGWENFRRSPARDTRRRPTGVAGRSRLQLDQAALDRLDRGDRCHPDPGNLRAHRRNHPSTRGLQLAILLGIGVLGVLLALADRLSTGPDGKH